MKSSFDSLVMQVTKVLRICMIRPAGIVYLKFQKFLLKILTEISHQRQLASKREM